MFYIENRACRRNHHVHWLALVAEKTKPLDRHEGQFDDNLDREMLDDRSVWVS